MARAVTIGNGSLLVGIDYRGQVRDLYYPHVGHSNHVSGASGSYVHRLGVHVDGVTSWLDDAGWEVEIGSDPDTVIGSFLATNADLGVELKSIDAVHNEKNIFLRSFTLTNLSDKKRTLTLYMAQQFRIAESRRGDTGLYDPRAKAIVHYKGHNTFLINAHCNGVPFTEYNIGLFGIEGKEGTWHDANDGVLEKNPIEHGSVDSVIGMSVTLAGGASDVVEYWVACGKTFAEVHALNQLVLDETPAALIRTTEHYWQAWSGKHKADLSCLSEPLQTLYRRSLTTMRVHADNTGGIIASSDTDMLHHGRDTYSYVWPRDGAIVAHAFDIAGYHDVSRRFLSFMTPLLEADGYFMHKYRTDGVLGSSWHPWIIEGEAEFPIQEDETALVLYMMCQHYNATENLEYIESQYNSFIEPAANFLVEFVEARYGLPKNSFDLWEEKFGIHTYTASAVFGALKAVAGIADTLGKVEPSRTYLAVAQKLQSAINEHLFDDELGMYIKAIRAYDHKDDVRDTTVDMSSFFGPWYFGVVDVNDERMERAAKTVEEKLRVHDNSDGYVRYEADNYYKMQDAASPNPWVVTTMWVAQFYIEKAETLEGLQRAHELLSWTASHATQSGVLAEQMHPHTRQHLSTAPLIWSHAEYVITCQAYCAKHKALSETDDAKS